MTEEKPAQLKDKIVKNVFGKVEDVVTNGVTDEELAAAVADRDRIVRLYGLSDRELVDAMQRALGMVRVGKSYKLVIPSDTEEPRRARGILRTRRTNG